MNNVKEIKVKWQQMRMILSREDDERAEACLLHFIEISNLPTVEERNVGEWLDNGDRYYRCSLCGMKDTDNWKFCRGCGAYMKGE